MWGGWKLRTEYIGVGVGVGGRGGVRGGGGGWFATVCWVLGQGLEWAGGGEASVFGGGGFAEARCSVCSLDGGFNGSCMGHWGNQTQNLLKIVEHSEDTSVIIYTVSQRCPVLCRSMQVAEGCRR